MYKYPIVIELNKEVVKLTVHKWKVGTITIAYWLSMGVIARLLYWGTGNIKPLDIILQSVWSSSVIIAAVFFGFYRKKFSAFAYGIVPYFISTFPLIGQIAVLIYVASQVFAIEESKINTQAESQENDINAGTADNSQDKNQDSRQGRRKLVAAAAIMLIAFGGYFAHQKYFFPGHEYVGEWFSMSGIVNISHEKNHFIIKITNLSTGKETFCVAQLNSKDQLEYKLVNNKTAAFTYIVSNKTLVHSSGGSVFLRSGK